MGDVSIKDLAREEKNKYLREWRKKNPDRVREYNRRYWRKKAAEKKKEGKK